MRIVSVSLTLLSPLTRSAPDFIFLFGLVRNIELLAEQEAGSVGAPFLLSLIVPLKRIAAKMTLIVAQIELNLTSVHITHTTLPSINTFVFPPSTLNQKYSRPSSTEKQSSRLSIIPDGRISPYCFRAWSIRTCLRSLTEGLPRFEKSPPADYT